jgi:hypothetical protein
VFVGELSGDEQRTQLLVNNFIELRDGADLSLGKVVDLHGFTSYSVLEENNRLAKIAIEFGAPRIALSEIALELNLINSEGLFPERPNTVYLPLIGTSRLAQGLRPA